MVCLISCSKKEADEIKPVNPDSGKTKLELLTNGSSKKWRVYSYYSNNGYTGVPNNCITDDTLLVSATGIRKYKHGSEECQYVEEKDSEVLWQLNSTQDSIYFIHGKDTSKRRIVELTSTKLNTSQSFSSIIDRDTILDGSIWVAW